MKAGPRRAGTNHGQHRDRSRDSRSDATACVDSTTCQWSEYLRSTDMSQHRCATAPSSGPPFSKIKPGSCLICQAMQKFLGRHFLKFFLCVYCTNPYENILFRAIFILFYLLCLLSYLLLIYVSVSLNKCSYLEAYNALESFI